MYATIPECGTVKKQPTLAREKRRGIRMHGTWVKVREVIADKEETDGSKDEE